MYLSLIQFTKIENNFGNHCQFEFMINTPFGCPGGGYYGTISTKILLWYRIV
jgi:hypothetical protein